MRKRTLISLMLTIVMILTASGIASAADSWKYYFPITVSDNIGATRTMYPVILEVGGQSLVDGGYLTANGTDARLRTTADKNLLMSTTNITFTVDSLSAYGQVTYDLYTGYSPEISAFQTIVGDGGYVTVADNTTLEPGDNFTVEQGGWVDTDNGTDKNLVSKPAAFRTFVSPVVSENITTQVLGVASTNALDFELTNDDFVSVPDDPAFTFNTAGDDDPFSIATYIRLESVGAVEAILSKWTTAGDEQEWLFYVDAAGKLATLMSDLGQLNTLIVTGDTVLSTATWYHIAMTYNGDEAWTDIKLYVNGVEETNTDSSGGTYVGMEDGTSTVNIGAINAGSTSNFDGIIYGLRIYDVELTEAEVAADAGLDHKATDLVALWLLTDGVGNPADTSGNGHNATSNNADWVTADTPSHISVTTTGVSSGKHIIAATANGSHIWHIIDGTPGTPVALNGVSIPDTSFDWTFLQNNVMPYADNITITVGGKQELWFEPNEMITSTTLPDRETATANDGTITWGSNDQVIVTFGSVTSYEAMVSAATVNVTGFVLPLVGIPDNWWGMEFDGTGLPFYPTFLDTSTQTGIPVQTLYLFLVFGAAIALATVTIVLTRSVVVGVAFYTVTMAYGANAGIVAWWIIYVFLIMVLGIIFLSSRQAMGG